MDFWEDYYGAEGLHGINMIDYYWDVNIASGQCCFIMFYLKTSCLGLVML